MTELTEEDVRQLFDYDSAGGFLRWRHRADVGQRWNSRYPGTVAGSASIGGVRVSVDGKGYLAHRLIWLHVYGRWPEGEIDHVDGNPHNNKLVNLRECSHAENHQNRGRAANNKSGFTGVGWHKQKRKWRADIKTAGRQKSLGLFDTIEDARLAYLAAKRQMHKFQPVPRDL